MLGRSCRGLMAVGDPMIANAILARFFSAYLPVVLPVMAFRGVPGAGVIAHLRLWHQCWRCGLVDSMVRHERARENGENFRGSPATIIGQFSGGRSLWNVGSRPRS
jgi:hypothetical protein